MIIIIIIIIIINSSSYVSTSCYYIIIVRDNDAFHTYRVQFVDGRTHSMAQMNGEETTPLLLLSLLLFIINNIIIRVCDDSLETYSSHPCVPTDLLKRPEWRGWQGCGERYRKMFLLVERKDIIVVKPEYFGYDLESVVKYLINEKYSSKYFKILGWSFPYQHSRH